MLCKITRFREQSSLNRGDFDFKMLWERFKIVLERLKTFSKRDFGLKMHENVVFFLPNAVFFLPKHLFQNHSPTLVSISWAESGSIGFLMSNAFWLFFFFFSLIFVFLRFQQDNSLFFLSFLHRNWRNCVLRFVSDGKCSLKLKKYRRSK